MHHPCQFEDGLLVDGRLKRKCLKKSTVLQVQNPHTRIVTLNPCFFAQFDTDACKCEDDGNAQNMVKWSETFMGCSDYSELLLNQAYKVSTSLPLISNFWYAELYSLRPDLVYILENFRQIRLTFISITFTHPTMHHNYSLIRNKAPIG